MANVQIRITLQHNLQNLVSMFCNASIRTKCYYCPLAVLGKKFYCSFWISILFTTPELIHCVKWQNVYKNKEKTADYLLSETKTMNNLEKCTSWNKTGLSKIDIYLRSSVASSSLAKQRSMFPDSSSLRSGCLKFLTIYIFRKKLSWIITI